MPNVHKSTSNECPNLLIISGAKYSGVPANLNILFMLQYNFSHFHPFLK